MKFVKITLLLKGTNNIYCPKQNYYVFGGEQKGSRGKCPKSKTPYPLL